MARKQVTVDLDAPGLEVFERRGRVELFGYPI
jgi:hypothetical protein